MAGRGVTRDGSGWVTGDLCVGLMGMLAGSRLLSHSYIRGKNASDHVNSSLVHKANCHYAITRAEIMSAGGQDRQGVTEASGACETASHQLSCPK